MNVMQIALIGVIGAMISIYFKSGKTEYGIYIGVAISILLFGGIMEHLTYFVSTISEIQNYIQIDTSYISTLLKMVGITYIAEFASSVCKDSGHATIAAQIELFSKLTILILSLPVLSSLLRTIQDFLS